MDATTNTFTKRLGTVLAALSLLLLVAVPAMANDADANQPSYWEQELDAENGVTGTSCVKYEGEDMVGHVSEDGTTWTPYTDGAVIIVKAGSSQSNDADPNTVGDSTGGKQISHVIECVVPAPAVEEPPAEEPETPETPETPEQPETTEEVETEVLGVTVEADDTPEPEVLGISIETEEEPEVLGVEILPETGVDTDQMVLIALGLLVLGGAFVWIADGKETVTAS